MNKVIKTDDYEGLVKFFTANGLEESDEDPVETEILNCWEIVDESKTPAKRIGGIVLSKRQGEFIIDGIAVDSEYRKQKIGKSLLDTAIAEVKERSGTAIFLVARAPGFFRTQGFTNVPKENAPLFFECLTCPQFEVSCHPEVMKLSLG